MPVVCSSYHTLCLDYNNNVWVFGYNKYGMLGINESDNFIQYNPIKISSLIDITLISCSDTFSMCVDSLGKVWGFGCNDKGQLGVPTIKQSNIPIVIESLPPIYSVHCGARFTICIDTEKYLWVFGENGSGQLGLSTCYSSQATPKKNNRFSNIKIVSCGKSFTYCIDEDGKLYTFGCNNNGKLGKSQPSIQPVILESDNIVIDAVCGEEHGMILLNNGLVYVTGNNNYCQLGYNSDMKSGPFKFIKVEGINLPIYKISCGKYHNICIDEEDSVWVFGSNEYGQLNIHYSLKKIVNPRKKSTFDNMNCISKGGDHCIFSNFDETILSCGRNDYGQLGIKTNSTKNSELLQLPNEYNNIISPINITKKCSKKSARK